MQPAAKGLQSSIDQRCRQNARCRIDTVFVGTLSVLFFSCLFEENPPRTEKPLPDRLRTMESMLETDSVRPQRRGFNGIRTQSHGGRRKVMHLGWTESVCTDCATFWSTAVFAFDISREVLNVTVSARDREMVRVGALHNRRCRSRERKQCGAGYGSHDVWAKRTQLWGTVPGRWSSVAVPASLLTCVDFSTHRDSGTHTGENVRRLSGPGDIYVVKF